jgi:dihydrofolate reductase
MRKIKLYIAASIDGFIAPPDGDLDWLVNTPRPSQSDYQSFLDSVDTVIIGGNTYRNMFCMDIIWPYKDKITYVVTRNPIIKKENVNYITTDVIEKINQLKQGEGKDIWLVGGGKLAVWLHEHNLIDEIILTRIPIMLDKGIPLFTNLAEKWDLSESQSYGNNGHKEIYKYVG